MGAGGKRDSAGASSGGYSGRNHRLEGADPGEMAAGGCLRRLLSATLPAVRRNYAVDDTVSLLEL